MAKIFLRKIQAGEITLEEVPEKWRDSVRELLGVHKFDFDVAEVYNSIKRGTTNRQDLCTLLNIRDLDKANSIIIIVRNNAVTVEQFEKLLESAVA